MKIIFQVFAMLFSINAKAYDCSAVKPFAPSGQQNVKITISRYVWTQGSADYEDVCSLSASINWYDVRHREEEAYYCLKPLATEVVICKTQLDGQDAEIEVLPASWIRDWSNGSAREYRFHSYVVKKNDPGYYYDIFSRSLSADLTSQNIIIEGSLKTGSSNPKDGFWVRVEFQK